ncbi:hypothetical protein WJX75_009358 [Coccomyxa subellipsoidea]|uniref:Rab3 GTPase-activating protein catalytic subunit n=1 Tax=Coccomyxa subellipsoidea TaxID=248742 RepID=A0ABR2YUQ5_9CHLO
MVSDDEDFVDYTTVTPWERFVAVIERVLSCWITAGLEDLDKLPGSKLGIKEGVQEVHDRPHKLQAWFGEDAFLTLIPSSYSRRILNEQEGSTLRSALAVALASTGCPWPAFVPMHDPLRDAYWGVAATCQGSFAFLETDSVHISQPPPQLLRVDGLLSLFSQRLAAHAPLAASAAKAVVHDTSLASMALTAAGRPPAAYARHVAVSERRTYRVPLPLLEDGHSDDSSEPEADWREDWDADCSWRPWAVHPDPIGHLEIDFVWESISAAAAVHGHATKAGSASHWRLHVLDPAQAPSYGHRIFSLQSKEPKRIHLRLSKEQCQRSQGPGEYTPKDTSFAGMLRALAAGSKSARTAKSMGQLASEEWWGRQGTHVPAMPPSSVLQDVLRDLFQAPALPSSFTRTYLSAGGKKDAHEMDALPGSDALLVPGSAPASSLAARLALHVLVFQSARAVAVLWVRMVRELRFAHWEAQEQLPRMGRPKSHAAEAASGQQQNKRHWQTFKQWQGPEAPDLAAGLLHQKLQMLNCCTFLRRHPEAGFVIAPAVTRQQPAQTTAAASGQGIDRADAGAAGGSSNSGLAQEVRRLVRKSKDSGAAGPSEDAGDGGSAAASDTDYASCCDDLAAAADVDAAAEGFAEPMEVDADVLYPSFELRLPSPMTSDMVAEREAALAALGEAGVAAKARMRGSMLLQAMQAFKAALPGASPEDFLDWQTKVGACVGLPPDACATKEAVEEVWQRAQPMVAAEQRPLWSAELEGERALHWLETLQPECGWRQLLLAALNAAALLLSRCKGAALPAAAAILSRFWQHARSVLGQEDPSEAQLEQIIDSLAWAERVVVVAEALMARLPGRPSLAARLLDACLQPAAAASPQPALLVALMQRQLVSVGDEPESTSSQQESASEASSRAAPPRRRSSSVDEAGPEDWAAPLQTVRLLQCEFGAGNGRAAPAVNNGGASASGSRHEHVHQLYARVRPGELRIATVVLMES